MCIVIIVINIINFQLNKHFTITNSKNISIPIHVKLKCNHMVN